MQVEFKTVKIDPLEFGIIAQDMVIHKGKLIQHKADIVAPFTYWLIRDSFRYSSKLWAKRYKKSQ